MFVTSGQFYVFVACVCFGGCTSILFSISALIKNYISNRLIKILPDVICFLLISVLYVLYSHALNFPDFRVYMIVGVLFGIFTYLKSFHILLAKMVKKLYNIMDKKLRRNKRSNNERKQG